MRPIVFNGKLYAGELNGVHRVADRLIREVDRLLGAMPVSQRPDVRLIVPTRRPRDPAVETIRVVEDRRADSQLWEQIVLPWQARDAVLVNLCNLAPLLHPRQLLMIHDAQFVFRDNGYTARARWGYRLLVPLMARAAARVLTVSRYSQATLDLTRISRRSQTLVIPNGVEHVGEQAPTADAADRFGLVRHRYVLLFGSTKEYKNIVVVLQAMAASAMRDLKLVIVGSSRADLARAGLPVPTNAVFVGNVDDATLHALYRDAICLAFPSRTEGFGLPPMEAMSVGCPALVAPAGALPEMCRDAAMYADVDDPDEWGRAIRALRDDRPLRAAKVAAGRARAAQFTWPAAGATLFAAASTLAKGR